MADSHELNLLIVDDDELNRDIIEEYLSGSEYKISTAEDGDDAITMLESEPDRFDIILLDRMMPRMDGMAVISRIMQHPQWVNIPVILQTARAGQQDILDGLKAGARYYLTKPFEEAMLRTVVSTASRERIRYLEIQQALEQSTRTLSLMDHGHFNFQTLEQASALATMLANACPDSKRAVTGFSELLINAIEHGNLAIGYKEKSRVNAEGCWEEEVNRRLQLPEYQDKTASVIFTQDSSSIIVVIKDQGLGFDWRKYLELDPERAFDNHGRGIAMAKMLSFDTLEYLGNGNEVRVTLNKHL